MVNENNMEDGYIFIGTKKALKTIIDNKGFICIPTKLTKNNVKINDIVEIINK
jgi:hypothetical protein